MSADIHTCSYQCDRPACIRAQRDELLAKLDAVTKDADGLREALKIAAGYMVEYAGLCKITGFDKLIPRITESADRIVALTDQGRAGEGRGDG